MSTAAQAQKIKRIVWTGSIAAVTVTGAWYGAGLKTRQEFKEKKAQVKALSIDEKLNKLLEQRAALVTRRKAVEEKIEEIRTRQQLRAEGAPEGGPREKGVFTTKPNQNKSLGRD